MTPIPFPRPHRSAAAWRGARRLAQVPPPAVGANDNRRPRALAAILTEAARAALVLLAVGAVCAVLWSIPG